MATLFPFNQLPKVPNLILEQFVPLLMEQQSKLNELADSLITDNDNLLPNVSCDDAQISEIKNKLQEAQQLIQNLTQTHHIKNIYKRHDLVYNVSFVFLL